MIENFVVLSVGTDVATVLADTQRRKDMTETNATNEYCCTCQSWHGERRYDPRRGKVKYENRAPSIPCNMNYRKPGACSKGNCKGYVRWVELG